MKVIKVLHQVWGKIKLKLDGLGYDRIKCSILGHSYLGYKPTFIGQTFMMVEKDWSKFIAYLCMDPNIASKQPHG